MEHFSYRQGEMFCEDLPLVSLAARFATPLYVYSSNTLATHCRNFLHAFASYPTLACYAVKANTSGAIMQKIFAHGFGADVVSLGELKRALRAGVSANRIVYSGVGKTVPEIQEALACKILSFNVESFDELSALAFWAKKQNTMASVSLRINVNIDAKTDPAITTALYSSKFGITEAQVDEFLRFIANHSSIKLVGIACHIGSQIMHLDPLRQAAERMLLWATQLQAQKFPLQFINMGGGLGIRYKDERPPSLSDYAKTLLAEISTSGVTLIVEPGRVLVGNIGVLLTQVLSIKHTPDKTFVVVDAAMNDLMRPALYNAYHEVLPVVQSSADTFVAQIVGPICETTDTLAENRQLPKTIKAGDYLMIRSCGAYASSMASNYNSRCLAAEVLVSGGGVQLIRRRQNLENLFAAEVLTKD